MKKILIAIAAVIGLVVLTGCVGKTVTETTQTLTDGTVIKTIVTESTSGILSEKTIATGGALAAVKLETAGGASTGTVLPNFLLGSGVNSFVSTPNEACKRAFSYSWSAGMLSSITNSSASNGSFSYISNENETAAETVSVINAALKIKSTISGEEVPEVDTSAITVDEDSIIDSASTDSEALADVDSEVSEAVVDSGAE